MFGVVAWLESVEGTDESSESSDKAEREDPCESGGLSLRSD